MLTFYTTQKALQEKSLKRFFFIEYKTLSNYSTPLYYYRVLVYKMEVAVGDLKTFLYLLKFVYFSERSTTFGLPWLLITAYLRARSIKFPPRASMVIKQNSPHAKRQWISHCTQ